MNISVIISCPIYNGKGHLTRVLSLASKINKKENQLTLYIVSKYLNNKELMLIKYFHKKNIIKEYSEIFTANFKPQAIILDDYNIPFKIIKKLNIICKKIFYFKDHNNINLKNIIPIKLKMIKKNNYFYFENFFINPELKFKKKIKKNNKILVSFGSGRVSTKLIIFLRFLKKIDSKLSSSYNLDLTNELNAKHLNIIKKLKKIKIKKINNYLFLKNINNYNFSINASGVTSLELLYLNIPQIVFLISKNQTKNFNNYKKINLNTIKTIDSLSPEYFSSFKKSFYFMIEKFFLNLDVNNFPVKVLFNSNKVLIDYISNNEN